MPVITFRRPILSVNYVTADGETRMDPKRTAFLHCFGKLIHLILPSMARPPPVDDKRLMTRSPDLRHRNE
jgi:hypothetical protein